jgi:hypothetical protein
MHHELAGERLAFVEHPSVVRIAPLRLRRASRQRRGRAQGRASEALGARSAWLRLSGRARSIRTVSLRTGSDALPLRSDARRERRGAFRSAYRVPTRGQRCPDRTKGCPARR